MKRIFPKIVVIIAFLSLEINHIKAQFVTVPDANFVAWLTSNYPTCMNGNLMDTTCFEIVNETTIDIFNQTQSNPNISDLTGIRYFDNLVTLECAFNYITNLPALPNSLSYLRCSNNQISSLPDLPNGLLELDCTNNQITNLSNLPNSITKLYCSMNQINNLSALPNSLIELYSGFNQLSNLPTLPNSLTTIETANNQLVSLPTLPNSLDLLNCENNLLSSLPALPNSITYLNCQFNQLINLPIFNNAIQTIYCGYNQLTNLPNFTNSIYYMDCRSNQIVGLPSLGNTLSYLQCQNNQLSNLPSLPNSLTYLNCSNNNLVSLPALPNSLSVFNCSNNEVSSLPALPSSLTQLYCSKNELSSLPNLPMSLTRLLTDSNNISCFPVFPGSLTNSAYLNITGNPFVCLPNYVNAMNASTLYIPLCNSVNLNGCATAAGITGKVYNESSINCAIDTTDLLLKNIKVNFLNPINSQFGISYTISNGVFNYPADVGTYLVLIDTLNKPYQSNCTYPGIDSTVITTTADPLVSNVNFDLKCKSGLDLNVQSVNHKNGLIFPGQTHTLQAMVGDASQWYGLNCANGTSGQVQITVTGPVTFNGTALGALTPSINGNVYTYSIVDFGTINNAADFQLLFLTNPTAQAGDQICVHVEAAPISGDINPTNNIKDFCYYVVNSYDPNYKEVYPTDVAPLYQDWLTYTIHFQNLGTAPAINIRLLDTLDSNLDAETFEVINYSHYNTVTLMDGILDIRFPNIMLPDSASNPSGSQGFVQYRIKPLANLPAGAQIANTAHIYFDFNPAVVTNTTVNNFVTTVGNSSITENKRLIVYPNPSTGIFTISSAAHIEVYNIVGALILSENNATSIDLTAAPKGMYFVKLNGDKIEKLIKK